MATAPVAVFLFQDWVTHNMAMIYSDHKRYHYSDTQVLDMTEKRVCFGDITYYEAADPDPAPLPFRPLPPMWEDADEDEAPTMSPPQFNCNVQSWPVCISIIVIICICFVIAGFGYLLDLLLLDT